MKKLKPVLTNFFGILMIVCGVLHFIKPEKYFPFIPHFLPKEIINYLVGVLEIVLGVGTCIPRFCSLATLGILLLMIVFLPLHVMDVFKEHPAIGNQAVAIIRLPVQFVLIMWAWFINKK